jgi:hypothetical protein
MTARKLSETGERVLRHTYRDNPELGEDMIRRINEWEPKPPLHAPGEVAHMTQRGFENLVKVLGVERATKIREDCDAWADMRNAAHAAGKHSTLYKAWTQELIEKGRRDDAERARRYRERKRLARLALAEIAKESRGPD